MEPQLIGTFTALGSDGRQRRVQVWMPYRPDRLPGQLVRWVPTGKAVLITEDGEDLNALPCTRGQYQIIGSDVILTADDSAEAVFAALEQCRLAPYRGRA